MNKKATTSSSISTNPAASLSNASVISSSSTLSSLSTSCPNNYVLSSCKLTSSISNQPSTNLPTSSSNTSASNTHSSSLSTSSISNPSLSMSKQQKRKMSVFQRYHLPYRIASSTSSLDLKLTKKSSSNSEDSSISKKSSAANFLDSFESERFDNICKDSEMSQKSLVNEKDLGISQKLFLYGVIKSARKGNVQ